MTYEEFLLEIKKELASELRRLQKMPYDWKVSHSIDVIREFVEHEGLNGVYVSFSGVKISPVCCELLKEKPLRLYEKNNFKSPIIGTRSSESFRRAVGWMKSGCNSFSFNRAKSTPLSLWLDSDIMRFIKEHNILLSPMYVNAKMKRTGCMFCPVPIAHGDYTNIDYVRVHHPKLYEIIMFKYGLKSMLEKVSIEGQISMF